MTEHEKAMLARLESGKFLSEDKKEHHPNLSTRTELLKRLEESTLSRLIHDSTLEQQMWGDKNNYRIKGTDLSLHKADGKWYIKAGSGFVLETYDDPLPLFWNKIDLKSLEERAKKIKEDDQKKWDQWKKHKSNKSTWS